MPVGNFTPSPNLKSELKNILKWARAKRGITDHRHFDDKPATKQTKSE